MKDKDMLLDLLPEIVEQILSHCTLSDLKNLSGTCSAYNELLREFLWQAVKITHKQIIPKDCINKNVAKSLKYTKKLSLCYDKIPYLNQMDKERIITHYKVILKHCNPEILQTSGVSDGYTCIGKLNNLVELDLYRSDVSDFNLHMICKLVSLEKLNMQECCKISNVGMGHIGAKLVNLRRLDISSCSKITDISAIATLPMLTHLNISKCRSLTNGISVIDKLVMLEELDISRCPSFTDDDYSAIGRLSMLVNLNVSGCDIRMAHIAKVVTLRRLDMSSCHEITDISAIANLVMLTHLNISCCRYITNGISVIGQLVMLEELDISWISSVTDDDLSAIGNLVMLTNLNMSMCTKVTNDGISTLDRLVMLKKLDVSGCWISDAGMSSLDRLVMLEKFDVSGCKGRIDDANIPSPLIKAIYRGVDPTPVETWTTNWDM